MSTELNVNDSEVQLAANIIATAPQPGSVGKEAVLSAANDGSDFDQDCPFTNVEACESLRAIQQMIEEMRQSGVLDAGAKFDPGAPS